MTTERDRIVEYVRRWAEHARKGARAIAESPDMKVEQREIAASAAMMHAELLAEAANRIAAFADGPPETGGPMRVYRIDEGGAIYTVAAPDIMSALAAWMRCTLDACGGVDDIDAVDCTELAQEAALGLMIRLDDGPDLKRSAWELAQEAKEPCVIGCSEW